MIHWRKIKYFENKQWDYILLHNYNTNLKNLGEMTTLLAKYTKKYKNVIILMIYDM